MSKRIKRRILPRRKTSGGLTIGSVVNCADNTGGGAFNSGEVMLSLGENATCTISNDDIPVANLSITKSDRRTTAAPGGATTYSSPVETGDAQFGRDSRRQRKFRAIKSAVVQVLDVEAVQEGIRNL